MSAASSGSQPDPQMTLMTFQPAPRKIALQLLDDLSVAAHRAVEALEVAVDDPDQVVQLLPPGQRDRAERLRLVHLAVAEERPHVPGRRVGQVARVQVLEEPGLVDRHDRTQAHRDRRELPEVRHQPRVRVRREPAARDLLAEPEELLLGDPALEERARVDAGGDVALHEQQVTAVSRAGGVPEVVETGVVERRRRLERRDVAAQLRARLVRPQHGRDRVPPVQRSDDVLQREVTRMRRLLVDRDGVDVRGVGRVRHHHGVPARLLVELLQEEGGPVRPVEVHNGVERVPPLLGLLGVLVLGHLRSLHCTSLQADVELGLI